MFRINLYFPFKLNFKFCFIYITTLISISGQILWKFESTIFEFFFSGHYIDLHFAHIKIGPVNEDLTKLAQKEIWAENSNKWHLIMNSPWKRPSWLQKPRKTLLLTTSEVGHLLIAIGLKIHLTPFYLIEKRKVDEISDWILIFFKISFRKWRSNMGLVTELERYICINFFICLLLRLEVRHQTFI